MSHAPVTKRNRLNGHFGYERYTSQNPNLPAVIDFNRLKDITIDKYIEKYAVPVTDDMTAHERRIAAARHFNLTTAPNLAQAAPEKHTIDRFQAHLSKLKTKLKNSRKRERDILKFTSRPAKSLGAASSSSQSSTADTPLPKNLRNRDPDEGYCLLSCKYNGSHKSGGTMIACDGTCHAEQWFHLSCVGLDDEPDGKWFCFTCIKERDRAKQSKSSGGSGGGTSKSEYVTYIKAALKSISQKKNRTAEGTAKEITAIIEKKFGSKLDTTPENDARKTPLWKARVNKILRSAKAGFSKVKKNGQCLYQLSSGGKK